MKDFKQTNNCWAGKHRTLYKSLYFATQFRMINSMLLNGMEIILVPIVPSSSVLLKTSQHRPEWITVWKPKGYETNSASSSILMTETKRLGKKRLQTMTVTPTLVLIIIGLPSFYIYYQVQNTCSSKVMITCIAVFFKTKKSFVMLKTFWKIQNWNTDWLKE